jgi:hypothetical protein
MLRIEIETQRRVVETYSAAVLLGPRSLAGLVGRYGGPFGARTDPSAISKERGRGVPTETACAAGRGSFVSFVTMIPRLGLMNGLALLAS